MNGRFGLWRDYISLRRSRIPGAKNTSIRTSVRFVGNADKPCAQGGCSAEKSQRDFFDGLRGKQCFPLHFIQLYSGSGLYLGSRREHVVSREISRELAESLGYLAQGQREVAEFGFRRFREKLGHSAADGVHSQD